MAANVKIFGSGWILLFILIGLTLDGCNSDQNNNYSLYCVTTGSVKSGDDVNTYSKKIRCHNPEFIHAVEDIYPSTLPSDTTHLDLSGNSITELTNSSLSHLTNLENLNLGQNYISIIHPDAFGGLETLKFLNLSYNYLRAIDSSSFKGLPKLRKLYLSKNYLSRISEGTFDDLVSLRTIDLSNNSLICDCHLKWILKWRKAKSIQLNGRTKCQYPTQLNSIRLTKLKENQWHCDWPPQVTYFTLKPAQSQVVFSGDSLQFQCQVSNVDSSIGLFWTLNDKEIDYYPESNDLITEVQSSTDGLLLLGSLIVQNLTQSHTGKWTCWVNTTTTNDSRSVFVRVLSETTRFCSETITTGNKGNYLWPRTVAGVKVELPCWSPASTDSRRNQIVSYMCSDEGAWKHLDTSKCPYISEVTKVLEQFAKTNLNITSSSVIETVYRLKNYTGDGSMLTDKMDVVFISRTITQYLEFVPKYKEISDVLIDIISVVMNLNENLLKAAELEDKACSKLTETVEKLPELVYDGPLSKQSSNIAVENVEINATGFRGITCASFAQMTAQQGHHGRTGSQSIKKSLRCLTHQNEQDESELLEASIYIPPSLINHVDRNRHEFHRLQMTFYKNSHLFPQTRESNKFTVVSGVIGSSLVKSSLTNMSEPVFVTLRSPNAIGKIIPVWWSQMANDGFGEWSSKGCQLRNVYGNLVSFQCDRLGYYGILQDIQKLTTNGKGNSRGDRFRILHPVVYVGSAICVHCLIAVVITYILGFRLIHIPKKNKHSLVNVCLAMTFLCLIFTLGIRHTEESKICQGVGLVLHYLTLVCLLWMVIIASNTYKKLNRSDQSDYLDEPPSDYPVPPKPMLRFYLVGWGVPVIICGISAAVNLEDYAGYDYCFLAFTHSVGAFYGPCGVLLFLLFIFYLLIFCSIKKTEALEKREQNAREGTEIELMETNCIQPQSTSRCVNQNNRPSSENSSEEDDMEQPLFSHLRAQIVILLLFLLSWAMAALSTTEPFSSNVSLAELLFGCAYAASVTTLGVFIVVFHCATREDVRLVWRMLYHCRESGIVRETVPLPQTNANNVAGVSEVRQSNDSINSSYTSKSCSTNQSVDGAKARLPKISNLEAALVMAGGVTDTSWSGEMFFNPYQNGVARKYFKKRAKQLQQSKNECPPLEEESVVEVNHLNAVDKLLPGLVPVRIKDKQAVVQCTNRVVTRDQSTESQLCSSSSQGLVSMSPSLSIGNRSDRSLLIVEEEEEYDQNSNTSQKSPTLTSPQNSNYEDNVFPAAEEYAEVDWGGSNVVSPRDMQFSPPSAAGPCTPTPTDPETKDISVSCNLNEFCDLNDVEFAAAMVADKTIGNQTKIGSEDNIYAHSSELARTNSLKKLPQRSGTLPRSNWEKQLSQRSNQPTYAYVNHSHHQNLADVLGQRPKYKGIITRSASVGDTELTALTKDNKQLKISQPSLHIGRLVFEQIGKKETSV